MTCGGVGPCRVAVPPLSSQYSSRSIAGSPTVSNPLELPRRNLKRPPSASAWGPRVGTALWRANVDAKGVLVSPPSALWIPWREGLALGVSGGCRP